MLNVNKQEPFLMDLFDSKYFSIQKFSEFMFLHKKLSQYIKSAFPTPYKFMLIDKKW